MRRFFKKVSKPHVDSSSSSNYSEELNSGEQNPPSDPALRPPIYDYNSNERDRIRRFYLTNGPCQPYDHSFPLTVYGDKMRKFNPEWFDKYKTWLEYSISKDAAFCLPCYLFRSENPGPGGGTNFVGEGFSNWKKGQKVFEDHIGALNSRHNEAERNCVALMTERQSIQAAIERQNFREEIKYRKRLEATVDTVYIILKQGLAFRGHDESESSNNKGNFLELLRWLGDHNKEIDDVILDKAPKNLKLIAPDIQKDIANAWADETTLKILEELGDELFSVLIDEARDASTKEQMAVVIRYVNKGGSVVERFLGKHDIIFI